MYNGVGLQTPRGSGTSGHVQTSRFSVKPRPSAAAGGAPVPSDAGVGMRKPNKDILEHDRKRQVELRLLVLRDALEEQGYTEGEIEERLVEARKAAQTEAAADGEGDGDEARPPTPGKGFADAQSQHAAVRKKQLQTLRAALGLDAGDVQKKAHVESNSDQELDATDAHKDGKA
ncbi:hypothetical protein ACP70R_037222 [Stipagrostis hirtigluma subsp. patula]